MSWEDVRASSCRNLIFPRVTLWRLLFVFLACTIWLSSAVSVRSFDRQTSAVPQSPKARLLFFTARWCAPCRKIKPYLARICDQNKTSVQLIEIDYDAAPVVAQEYAVDSLPTIILLDNSGILLMRVNESGKEGLKALSSEIRKLAKIKRTMEKNHAQPSVFPSPH